MSLSNDWKDVDSVCHAANNKVMVVAQFPSKGILELYRRGMDHHMACEIYVMNKDASTSLEPTRSATYVFNISYKYLSRYLLTFTFVRPEIILLSSTECAVSAWSPHSSINEDENIIHLQYYTKGMQLLSAVRSRSRKGPRWNGCGDIKKSSEVTRLLFEAIHPEMAISLDGIHVTRTNRADVDWQQ